jgi:GTP 3',8-cyclase
LERPLRPHSSEQPADRPPTDRFGRPLHDLRISVTDRCNLRCGYCMPRETFGPDFAFVPRAELLSFEEIARVVTVAAELGVARVRITGGEPLLRRDLPRLVRAIGSVPGIDDVALTTNGVLLPTAAGPLAAAGLQRVTVSLDALDPAIFAAMSDSAIPVERVLEGIAAARRAGLDPIKLNVVVKRGMNVSQLVPIAGYGREQGLVVRFIEFMDVGGTNGWQRRDVVPAEEIVARIDDVHPLEPVPGPRGDQPAERFRYLDGVGEIGVIASVTRPFCRSCVRARISPVGELFTCLFAGSGHDLRRVLRDPDSGDDELRSALAAVWSGRADRYSELRGTKDPQERRVEMSYIGG